MPPIKMKGDGRKAKDPKKTILRLLSYLKQYTPALIIVVICILVSSVAQAASSASLGTLVDDHIKPLLGQTAPSYAGLIKFLCIMAGLYLLGIVSAFLYNFLMAHPDPASLHNVYRLSTNTVL